MRNLITLLSLVVLAVACTYQLDGEFVNNIDPNKEPQVSVSLNDLQPGATITILQTVHFTFNYSIEPGKIKSFHIMIDSAHDVSGSTIQNDSGITLGFDITPVDASPGLHNLQIIVTSTSGTGSIADIEGLEQRVVVNSWKLKFINDVPPTPVVSLSEENGYLKISWTPYTRVNFDSYVLVMSRSFDDTQTRVFKDSLTTSFIDSAYVGGYPKTYSVATHTITGGSPGGTASAYGSFDINYEIRMSDTTYLFTWNKAKYAGPFKDYYLAIGINDVYTISDVNDTSFRYDPGEFIFGAVTDANLTLHPKDRNPTSFAPTAHVRTDPYLPGTKKFNANFVAYNKTTDRVYGFPYDENTLRKYSADLDDLNDPLDRRTSVPFSGPTGYGPVDGVGINAFDLETKTVTDQLDIASMTNEGKIYGINSITGTSTGVVLVYFLAKDDFQQIRQFGLIYDMVNNTVLSPVTVNYPGAALSGNGKYLRVGVNLYINNGSFFDIGWTLPNTSCRFRDDNPDEIICPVGNVYEIRKSTDGSLLRSVPVPAGTYLNMYDPVKHILMFFIDGEPTVYKCTDIESLQTTTIHGIDGVSMVNGNFVDVHQYFYKAIQ